MAAYRQNRMLEPGERAPDFDLQDDHGRTRSLRDLVKSGPVLVAFFKTDLSGVPACLSVPRPHPSRPGRARAADIRASPRTAPRPRANSPMSSESPSRSCSTPMTAAIRPAMHTLSRTCRGDFLVEPDGVISWTMEGFEKKALESLGAKAGVATFTERDQVPVFKAG